MEKKMKIKWNMGCSVGRGCLTCPWLAGSQGSSKRKLKTSMGNEGTATTVHFSVPEVSTSRR